MGGGYLICPVCVREVVNILVIEEPLDHRGRVSRQETGNVDWLACLHKHGLSVTHDMRGLKVTRGSTYTYTYIHIHTYISNTLTLNRKYHRHFYNHLKHGLSIDKFVRT